LPSVFSVVSALVTGSFPVDGVYIADVYLACQHGRASFLKKNTTLNKTPYFLRLEPSLIEGAQMISKREGVTVTSIVEDALTAHLKHRVKAVINLPRDWRGEE